MERLARLVFIMNTSKRVFWSVMLTIAVVALVTIHFAFEFLKVSMIEHYQMHLIIFGIIFFILLFYVLWTAGWEREQLLPEYWMKRAENIIKKHPEKKGEMEERMQDLNSLKDWVRMHDRYVLLSSAFRSEAGGYDVQSN